MKFLKKLFYKIYDFIYEHFHKEIFEDPFKEILKKFEKVDPIPEDHVFSMNMNHVFELLAKDDIGISKDDLIIKCIKCGREGFEFMDDVDELGDLNLYHFKAKDPNDKREAVVFDWSRSDEAKFCPIENGTIALSDDREASDADN